MSRVATWCLTSPLPAACNDPCLTCEGGANTCSSCHGGNYLMSTMCVADCGAGMYGDHATGVCQGQPNHACPLCGATLTARPAECDDTCSTCSGGSSSECSSCTGPNFPFFDDGSCVASCPSGKFGYSQNNTCVTQCPQGLFGDPNTALCSAPSCANDQFAASLQQCQGRSMLQPSES